MKVFVFAFLLVAVGAHALPQQHFDDESGIREERNILVVNRIKRALEQMSRSIVEAGLDPMHIDRFDYEASPVPILVTVNVWIEKLNFEGLSIIAANNIEYSTLLNRLRFDISLPELSLSVGGSGIRANVFGNRITAEFSGKLVITQIRLKGEVRVSIGIISGISIRSLELDFGISNIRSDLRMGFQGEDYSNQLNTMMNEVIPRWLEVNKDEINKFISDLALRVANEALGRNMITEDQVLIA